MTNEKRWEPLLTADAVVKALEDGREVEITAFSEDSVQSQSNEAEGTGWISATADDEYGWPKTRIEAWLKKGQFRAVLQESPATTVGGDAVFDAVVADARAWALIELAQVNGAVADEGEDGKFWTLDLAAWKALDEALEAIYLPERTATPAPLPAAGWVVDELKAVRELAANGYAHSPVTSRLDAVIESLAAAPASPAGGVGQWVRCTPNLLNAGVDCAKTPRRAGDGASSHDHFIAHNAASPAGGVVTDAVERVAQHIESAVEYIDKVYPNATQLDRGPILRNMRRWSAKLRAALSPEAPAVGGGKQAASVSGDAVERVAKHLCREEWKDKGLPLNEMMRRLETWPRFVDEARAILNAATPPATTSEEG